LLLFTGFGGRMDTKKLEIMLDALRTGSLLKTSETYGYTPSGLVHMMNTLENEMGVKLLERGHFGIRPNAEAEQLMPYFQDMLELDKKIHTKVLIIQQKLQKEIRIGAYTSVAKQWLPSLINEYVFKNPDAAITIKVGARNELYQGLENHSLDLCFIAATTSNCCSFTPIAKDYLYAVIPKNQDMDNTAAYDIKNMDGVPFIMPSYSQDEDIGELLEKHQVNPQIKAIAVDDPVVLSMVSYGMGVSILSGLVIGQNQENITAVPLSPPSFRQISIATNKAAKVPAHVKDFIRFVKNNPQLTPTDFN